MTLSKNSKKAGLALIGSMAGFLVAKHLKSEETYPFILIGGFVGNFVGEEYIPEELSANYTLPMGEPDLPTGRLDYRHQQYVQDWKVRSALGTAP